MHTPAAAPDTKDWTWVLRRPCPECGLSAGAVPAAQVARRVREVGRRWQPVLASADVGRRPAPATWSPLEHGAHVAEVLTIAGARLRLLLTETDPVFADGDQDAAARTGRYGQQHPGEVAAQVASAAEDVAVLLDGVRDDAWARPGRRSNGSVFTVATLAQYVLHDVVHHLHDVAQEAQDAPDRDRRPPGRPGPDAPGTS